MPAPESFIVDQYKAYMGDVANIGTRYTTAQSFYLSIVSALVAVAGFAGKDATAFTRLSWGLALGILILIALICYVWWRTLDYYHHLFEAKFVVLKKIETEKGLLPIFQWESSQLGKRTLIGHEELIPVIIGIAACLGAAGVIVKSPLLSG